jgi:hypothetical protein
MVFIGVRWCCGRRLGTWCPVVKPANHATWPSGQVSSLHHLWALDTLSTAFVGHVDKMVFGIALTHGRPAGPGDVVGQSHLASVEPVLCATSFLCVI